MIQMIAPGSHQLSPSPPTQNREIHHLRQHWMHWMHWSLWPCNCICSGYDLSVLQGLAMKLSSALLSMSVSSSLSLEPCQHSDTKRSFQKGCEKQSSISTQFPPGLIETDQFYTLRNQPMLSGSHLKATVQIWIMAISAISYHDVKKHVG